MFCPLFLIIASNKASNVTFLPGQNDEHLSDWSLNDVVFLKRTHLPWNDIFSLVKLC